MVIMVPWRGFEALEPQSPERASLVALAGFQLMRQLLDCDWERDKDPHGCIRGILPLPEKHKSSLCRPYWIISMGSISSVPLLPSSAVNIATPAALQTFCALRMAAFDIFLLLWGLAEDEKEKSIADEIKKKYECCGKKCPYAGSTSRKSRAQRCRKRCTCMKCPSCEGRSRRIDQLGDEVVDIRRVTQIIEFYSNPVQPSLSSLFRLTRP